MRSLMRGLRGKNARQVVLATTPSMQRGHLLRGVDMGQHDHSHSAWAKSCLMEQLQELGIAGVVCQVELQHAVDAGLQEDVVIAGHHAYLCSSSGHSPQITARSQSGLPLHAG